MDQNDRQIIDDLFAKLAEAQQQAPQRDAQAEALIREHLAQQPNAPYYMLQAIAVQQQALMALQRRVEELEHTLKSQSGGIFGRLFGSAPPVSRPAAGGVAPYAGAQAASAWGRPHHQGGFMAGAMQTAMGVAGGVLIGNALAGMLAPDEAAAEEAAADADEGADFGSDEEF